MHRDLFGSIATLPALVVDRLPALPTADLDRATSYAKQDKSPATRQAYRADFASFRGRGVRRRLTPCHA
jgi:hypothetical protein